MNAFRNVSSTLFCVLLAALLAPGVAMAQEAGAHEQAAEAPTADQAEEPAPAKQDKAKQAEQTFSVPVKVVHGGQEAKTIGGKPVILRAARPKGPFEQQDPKPAREWTAVTNASGLATFEGIPTSLADEGLRLHALTTHGGMTFKSSPKVPARGISLEVPVYERGNDLSKVKIQDLQTIVHVWEDNLYFQQFYRLTVEGNQVFDTALLTGEEYEHGMPLDLPLKAMGIEAQAPGATKVVESTVFWKGSLKPGEAVPISASFSMTANRPEFSYSQDFDYPVDNVSVVVPLEPNNQQVKIRYFSDLTIAAPGFDPDNVGVDEGALGSQNDGLFLTAKNRSIEAGGTLKFQLGGLPFDRPIGAWAALGLGILGALLVFAFARREKKRVDESHSSGEIIDLLSREREELLDELALLEEDYQDGRVSELEYERESLLLRERIALVMKKIRDLEDNAA